MLPHKNKHVYTGKNIRNVWMSNKRLILFIRRKDIYKGGPTELTDEKQWFQTIKKDLITMIRSLSLPGSVLLWRDVSPTTIGAGELNDCVRHGNRCGLSAITTRQCVCRLHFMSSQTLECPSVPFWASICKNAIDIHSKPDRSKTKQSSVKTFTRYKSLNKSSID